MCAGTFSIIAEATAKEAGGIPAIAVGFAIMLAGFAVMVHIIIDLARKGDPDANRYGDPPR